MWNVEEDVLVAKIFISCICKMFILSAVDTSWRSLDADFLWLEQNQLRFFRRKQVFGSSSRFWSGFPSVHLQPGLFQTNPSSSEPEPCPLWFCKWAEHPERYQNRDDPGRAPRTRRPSEESRTRTAAARCPPAFRNTWSQHLRWFPFCADGNQQKDFKEPQQPRWLEIGSEPEEAGFARYAAAVTESSGWFISCIIWAALRKTVLEK